MPTQQLYQPAWPMTGSLRRQTDRQTELRVYLSALSILFSTFPFLIVVVVVVAVFLSDI